MQLKRPKIAVLTSGGDAPGMNAAIRAITLACHSSGYSCIGFFHGYNGLIDDEWCELTPRLVNPTLQQGGTLLKSARCKAMLTSDGVKQAANTLYKHDIDALIVVGGDGSFRGMLELEKEWRGQLIGLPGTIDNDLAHCDATIGFATAVQTAASAIDKIRDTANAFERVFIVEVMGRHSGHIAFAVGLATGAEAILSFENCQPPQHDAILSELTTAITQQQQVRHGSYLIVCAENLWPGGASALQKALKERAAIDSAVCILGHIQRGGSPVVNDRLLASKLGLAAVEAVEQQQHMVMLGEIAGNVVATALNATVQDHKPVASFWLKAHRSALKGDLA
ncbi:6-phosphofructokinase [Pseudoalteromonas fenneropenaei]|uniref:6-phosphofructokinase n=1 Tax=Pseudoalteromonas fenneropenaei TaxID=1737459 RepID=A0ABV7CCJ9_9GAMM